MKYLAALVVAATAACTTLGPMPATTGIAAVPNGRPGVEFQTGFVPAFYLSQAVQDHTRGTITPQASAVFEPDRLLNLPGLIVGGRMFGEAGDTLGEPYLGYRRKLDDGISVAAVIYGTSQRATRSLATYHATRFGGEAMLDARVVRPTPWSEIHLQASVQATQISASGRYCIDQAGVAIDCDTEQPSSNTMIDGHIDSIFPAATASVTVDLARSSHRWVQNARLALLGAFGTMPLVVNGVVESTGNYAQIGMTFTLGFGSPN